MEGGCEQGSFWRWGNLGHENGGAGYRSEPSITYQTDRRGGFFASLSTAMMMLFSTNILRGEMRTRWQATLDIYSSRPR